MAASYNGDKCYMKYGWNSVNMLKYDRFKGPECKTEYELHMYVYNYVNLPEINQCSVFIHL